jgi:anti-sigma-K factor RskA
MHMEKENWDSMLIDYLEGSLSAVDCKRLEEAMATDAELAKRLEQTKQLLQTIDNVSEVEPSGRLMVNFQQLIREEQQKSTKVISFSMPQVYRMAAGLALLVMAGFGAYWYQASKIADLAIQMEQTKTSMMAMLHNQGSAGQRLQGVQASFQIEQADDEIVLALVNTLETDVNTNVRLAALDALARFHSQPHVRKALVTALNKQQDPIVQIALIKLLVEVKEQQVLDELKRLSTDELTLPAVQDEAHAGILKLS